MSFYHLKLYNITLAIQDITYIAYLNSNSFNRKRYFIIQIRFQNMILFRLIGPNIPVPVVAHSEYRFYCFNLSCRMALQSFVFSWTLIWPFSLLFKLTFQTSCLFQKSGKTVFPQSLRKPHIIIVSYLHTCGIFHDKKQRSVLFLAQMSSL